MISVHLLRLLRMFAVLTLQILVISNIHILGYVTPLIIGYMIIPFYRESGRIEMLLWGFVTGLVFDMFSNTAGMGAAACTMLAMFQPSLVKVFTPRDAPEDFKPSLKTIGAWRFCLFCILCMLILHIVFYALDAFTIANWQLTLTAIGVGTLVSAFIAIIVELICCNKY